MKKLIHTLALQSIKVKLLGLLLFLAGNLQACSDEETASIQVNADVLYFNGRSCLKRPVGACTD